MIYLQLFLSFLKIGLFSFGGGYACSPTDPGAGCYRSWMAER